MYYFKTQKCYNQIAGTKTKLWKGPLYIFFSAASITEQFKICWSKLNTQFFCKSKALPAKPTILLRTGMFCRNQKSSAEKRYLCLILLVFLAVCFTKCIVKVSDWILRILRNRRMIPHCLWILWCIFCMSTPL